jgi:hypothetical protein
VEELTPLAAKVLAQGLAAEELARGLAARRSLRPWRRRALQQRAPLLLHDGVLLYLQI